MESIALLFKVFWAPGEAMFKASKKPGAGFAAIGLLIIAGMITSFITISRVNMGEITLRMMDQSPRFQSLTAAQRQQIVANSNGTMSHVFAVVGAVIGPVLTT